MKVGKIKKNQLKTYKKESIKTKSFGFTILITAIAAASLFIYFRNKNTISTETTLENSETIIESLSKVILINENETVKVALIQNADELKKANPTFYANSQNGDYYVVLPESSRVLIYRQQENILVNFSTFTLNINAIDESLIPEDEKPLNIEIRYTDSVTEDDLNILKSEITTASESYTISSTVKTNASNLTGASIVILNYQNKPNIIQNFIADSQINAISQQLPHGEDTSTADLIVFISK